MVNLQLDDNIVWIPTSIWQLGFAWDSFPFLLSLWSLDCPPLLQSRGQSFPTSMVSTCNFIINPHLGLLLHLIALYGSSLGQQSSSITRRGSGPHLSAAGRWYRQMMILYLAAMETTPALYQLSPTSVARFGLPCCPLYLSTLFFPLRGWPKDCSRGGLLLL